MTPPPSKRQRRSVVPDNDSLALNTSRPSQCLNPGPVVTLPKRNPFNRNGAPKKPPAKFPAKASRKSSPEKANRRSNKAEKDSKSLHIFFGTPTEVHRGARKDKTPPSAVEDGEAGDAIEDDSLEEAFAELLDREGNEDEILHRQKGTEGHPQDGAIVSAKRSRESGLRFVKPSKPATREREAISGHDDDILDRPWAERFAPTSLEELAVHKKKVKDVQNWLNAVLQGRDRRRLLILKGPAGSGKTTTISLIAQVMGIEVIAWRSPTVVDSGLASFSSQFDDFINRAAAFGALEVSSSMPTMNGTRTAMNRDARKRILLVEDFPSTLSVSSSPIASFRNVLHQYLAAAVPPRSAALELSASHLNSHPPIVLIVSESILTSATASNDSFTAHRLLGSDLCNHPYATLLEFNPIAPTLVIKALELAIKKEARVSKRRRIPSMAILNRLSVLGDVRSAINGLEFLCVRGDSHSEGNSDWGGRTAAEITKSMKGGSALTSMENGSLELATQREATLGIFHAVGKVVWNKRVDSGLVNPPPASSSDCRDDASALLRSKLSQVDTDELLNEIGTDIQTFIAALHENYVLSTHGPCFTGTVSNCIDFLSESDLFDPGSKQITRSSLLSPWGGVAGLYVGGVDLLRQNEISFHTAVRGLLCSLPSPVSRAPHPSGRKGDSFKIFYPASLKIWKSSEEIHDQINSHIRLLLTTGVEGLGPLPNHATPEGVESWRSRSFSHLRASDDHVHNHNGTSRVWATRHEVLLERLPYMARMQQGNDKMARDIQKITHLTGIQLNGDEEAADEDDAELVVNLSAADETTDQIGWPGKGISIRPDISMAKSTTDRSVETAVEKLYISEDDIEDD